MRVEWKSDLEVYEEAIELLLAGTTVKVLATSLKQDADKTDAEEMLGRIKQ